MKSKSGMSHFGHFGFISITGSKSICAVSIDFLYVTYQYTACSDRNQNRLSTSCGILKSQNHVCPKAVPDEKGTRGKFLC